MSHMIATHGEDDEGFGRCKMADVPGDRWDIRFGAPEGFFVGYSVEETFRADGAG
jgi:hypothetical protein